MIISDLTYLETISNSDNKTITGGERHKPHPDDSKKNKNVCDVKNLIPAPKDLILAPKELIADIVHAKTEFLKDKFYNNGKQDYSKSHH